MNLKQWELCQFWSILMISSHGMRRLIPIRQIVKVQTLFSFTSLLNDETGGGGAGRYLSMSKDGGGHEYVAYTVHIPPTPDHQFMANSQDCLEYGNVQGDPNENRIKDRVFTGWFDSETRAHAKRMKSMEVSILKSKLLYQVNGCDQKLFMNPLKLNVNAGSESVQGFT
ncbi:hypothetical protein Tco_0164380 [Tanacetum coccineum]